MSTWIERPIGELCSQIIDCINKTAPTVDEVTPYRMLRTTNVRNGQIDLKSVRYVNHDTYQCWTRRGVPVDGDIVLTREAPLGEVGLLRDARGVFLGQRLVMYRADPKKVDRNFLFYAMRGPDIQAQIKALGSGATVEHMRIPDCSGLMVACPPAPVQKKIGRLLGALDELIAINERRIELLREAARLLYNEWFVRFHFPGHEDVVIAESDVGPVPKGWATGSVGDFLEVIGGGTPSKTRDEFWADGTIDWFTPSDLTRERARFVEESSVQITTRGLENSSARLFPEGSVLMTSRATLGVLAIAAQEATCNQGFIVVPPIVGIPSAFLYEWLDHKKHELEQIATGATFKEITKSAFKRFPFVRPAPEVLRRFAVVVEPIDGDIASNERMNRRLAAIRDLLLPRLVTGRVDISEVDLGDLLPMEAPA